MANLISHGVPLGIIRIYWLTTPVRKPLFYALRNWGPRKYRGWFVCAGTSARAYRRIRAGEDGWSVFRDLKLRPPQVGVGDGDNPYPNGWA